MNEILRRNVLASMATLTMLGGIALCHESNVSAAPTDTIPTEQERLDDINNCMATAADLGRLADYDCDGDGITEDMDLIPFFSDDEDADGDLVVDAQDEYPGEDDKLHDWDEDGVPDYLDAWEGQDYGDDDGDMVPNFADPTPFGDEPTDPATPTPTDYSGGDGIPADEFARMMQMAQINMQINLNNMYRDQFATPGYNPFMADHDHDHIPDFYDRDDQDPFGN